MRGVKSGKNFENSHISNGCSAKIQMNNLHSNGYNDFCEDSYLNSKYYMKKVYEDGTIVDTTIDKHKKGIGHGKLVSVEIIGVR